MNPVHRHLGNEASTFQREGPWEQLTCDGRCGWIASSVHSRGILEGHTLNAPQGALTLWALAVDDLNVWNQPRATAPVEDDYTEMLLLAEHREEAPKQFDAAGNRRIGPLRDWQSRNFALVWSATWYPQFFAKFFPGGIYGATPFDNSAYYPRPKALVCAGHWSVRRERWQQIALTWDRPGSDYRLYVNGVQVAASTMFEPLEHFHCCEKLVVGNPVWALSDLRFFEGPADGEWVANEYRKEATQGTDTARQALLHTYTGANLEAVNLQPPEHFKDQLVMAMDNPEDAAAFQVQGMPDCVTFGRDGLDIRTPDNLIRSQEGLDLSQGYVWTRQAFRGDLFLEFEFMPLKENGLALLCLQTAGMQGEDFMSDHPLRAGGSMKLVWGDNVRLYHWEYFREMDDTYHRCASHGLFKQPWQKPLAYQCLPERLQQGVWHKIQFLQDGERLRGSLNGQLLFDVRDNANDTTGPILRNGHIGFRCMYKTHLKLRNLRVATHSAISRTANA